MRQIKIRAHHGICLCYFAGKGYSSEFVENMAYIKSLLEKNPLVCITSGPDDICSKCPNNHNGICVSEDKVAQYDKQVFDNCNISDKSIMPYFEFKNSIRNNILLPQKRKEICGSCQWDSLCN